MLLLNDKRYMACSYFMLRRHSHVAPGGNATLVDAAGQVDQLAVVVLQAVCT